MGFKEPPSKEVCGELSFYFTRTVSTLDDWLVVNMERGFLFSSVHTSDCLPSKKNMAGCLTSSTRLVSRSKARLVALQGVFLHVRR